jgi:hypothetical protein
MWWAVRVPRWCWSSKRSSAGAATRSTPRFSDLNMLVLPGVRERTEQEYTALFDSAGLHLARIIDTGTRYSILEAVEQRQA